MVINGLDLIAQRPIVDMLHTKEQHGGVSHGLVEVGYDIRIKQAVTFKPYQIGHRDPEVYVYEDDANHSEGLGRFALASSIEQFDMPRYLMGVVHDKSTWARRGLSVFNTVIEPGWRGFLTLELVYHGSSDLVIPAGAGIAQVIFHRVSQPASYCGKYQDQEDRPVDAICS